MSLALDNRGASGGDGRPLMSRLFPLVLIEVHALVIVRLIGLHGVFI